MAIATTRVTILLVVLVIVAIGGVSLQVFLSRRESKWPGLVLPALCMLYPLMLILNVAAVGSTNSIINTLIIAFFMGNIPAVILLVIYFACREKRRRRSELDKMRITDL